MKHLDFDGIPHPITNCRPREYEQARRLEASSWSVRNSLRTKLIGPSFTANGFSTVEPTTASQGNSQANDRPKVSEKEPK